MYRMLIVDDEQLIAQGMQRAIARLELFEIETVYSGREALERVLAGGVDAMLLDINIPDMTGIEIMRALSEREKMVPTVIISGYEEFDYAKLAMRYGAMDYVLKPVLPKDVAAIGLKIFECLESAEQERRRNEELRRFVMEHRTVIKQKLLSDILAGSVQRTRLEEIHRLYGIDLRGEYFTAVVICIRRARETLEELDFQIGLRRVEQEIERAFTDVPEANLFNMENARYALLISAALPFDAALLERLLDQTADALNAIEGLEAYIGQGEEVRGLEQVAASYRSANDALDYQAMFQNDRIYAIRDYRKNARLTEIQHMLTAMETHLRRMQYDGAEELINRIFDWIGEGEQLTGPELQFMFSRMSCALMSVMLENGLITVNAPTPELQPADSPRQLRGKALAMLGVIRREIYRSYSDKNRGISRRVKEYIAEHYSDSGLSVNRISAEMNYSANYLGNAFKREYGESINDYLGKCRVEAAKHLMDETDMRIYEIAFAVGFNDQHYFSKTFRRFAGMSPSEYRGD